MDGRKVPKVIQEVSDPPHPHEANWVQVWQDNGKTHSLQASSIFIVVFV